MAERVRQFQAFYEKRNARPLVGFTVGSEFPMPRYRSTKKLPTGRPLTPEDFDVKAFQRDCRELFERHESYGGDFIWSASAFWGIPWVEALMGMEIYANNQTGSLYAALPKGYEANDRFVFQPENPWAALCREFLAALAEESRGDFPLATTRIRGVADILSMLYHGEEMIFAMLEDADTIRRIASAAERMILDFARFQLQYIPDFYGGIGSFYYNLWAPKGTVWYQEDATALLSPELYDEFIREHDRNIASKLDGCIIHQHPTGYMPYEKYLQMPFTAQEMHIDHAGPSAEQLLPVFRRIQQGSRLILWGGISESDLETIFTKLPPEGLAVCCMVQSMEEADFIWNRYIQK